MLHKRWTELLIIVINALKRKLKKRALVAVNGELMQLLYVIEYEFVINRVHNFTGKRYSFFCLIISLFSYVRLN